jgi:hypothetical protein
MTLKEFLWVVIATSPFPLTPFSLRLLPYSFPLVTPPPVRLSMNPTNRKPTRLKLEFPSFFLGLAGLRRPRGLC